MRKKLKIGDVWMFLPAFIFFAICGVVVYAWTASSVFDVYKVEELDNHALSPSVWNNLMDDLNRLVVPNGAILAFAKSTCPEGWEECSSTDQLYCIKGHNYGGGSCNGGSVNYNCEPKQYYDGGECKDCDDGTWSIGGNTTLCSPCLGKPEHAIWTGNGDSEDGCEWECVEGFKENNNECEPDCSPKYYWNSTVLECRECDDGEWSAGGYVTSCSSCSGKPGNAYWASNGSSVDDCEWRCEAGYYIDGNLCKQCPAGSYCPRGSSGPISCGPDYGSLPGAKSFDDCKRYVSCNPGYYLPMGGIIEANCTICPASYDDYGYYCPGGLYLQDQNYNQGIDYCYANDFPGRLYGYYVAGNSSSVYCYWDCYDWHWSLGHKYCGN